MTLQGAIQQLHDMRCNEKFPIYYKSAIDEVIKTIVADAQEVRRGRWMEHSDEWDGGYYECSVCGEAFTFIEGTPKENLYNYCPNCGARMEETE